MNCLYTVCEQPHACSDDSCNRIVNNIHKNMEEGLELLDPTELYNMLQQATIFSNLTDPNYLLLMGKYLEFILFYNELLHSILHYVETWWDKQ